MEPLEVFAINESRCRCTGSIPYTSLQWCRRYYECGQFKMVVPADIYEPSWAFICTADRPETGRIQKVEFKDAEQGEFGSDEVEISGFFLESYMFDKTFLDEQNEEFANMIASAEPKNPMVTDENADNENRTLYIDVQGTYYVTDSSGNISYQNEDGDWVDLSIDIHTAANSDGSKYLILEDGTTADQVRYFTLPNVYYYTDGTNLHAVSYNSSGASTDTAILSENILVQNDNINDTYYKDSAGNVYRAHGVAKDTNGNYSVSVYDWRTGTYRDVAIKGAWSLLGMSESYAAVDNVERVTEWAQDMFKNGITWIKPTITGTVKVIDPSFKSVGELLYQELQSEGASFRLVYDFELDKLVFEIYRGLDRTQGQNVNPWMVLSDAWGTLYDYTASVDTSNYKNKCYVLYDYEEPSWDSAGKPVISNSLIKYSRKKGMITCRLNDGEPDRECYLDMRSEKPNGDSDWKRDAYTSAQISALPVLKPSYDAFKRSLENEGYAYLRQEFPVEEVLDTGKLDSEEYLTNFDLGDKIDVYIHSLGVNYMTRIVGVDEAYEAGKAKLSLQVGEESASFKRKTVIV